MKVLMAIPYVASIYGGPSRVVQELARSIGQKDISVDVITTNANGASKLDVQTRQWIEQDGYRIQYFDCIHYYDSIFSFSLCQWLVKQVSAYDVVHTHSLFAPTMSFVHWLCRYSKIPYIVTPHGMLEPWALSYKASKKKLYYQHLEAPSLATASAIHVLNRRESSQVEALGFSQTEVVHNGVRRCNFTTLPDSTSFYQRFPETKGKKIVLFLGRVDPKKGLDLLAIAFAKVHQNLPETHLVIAGPDSIDFLSTVQRYFFEAGCLPAVTFTGMLSGSLKYAALATASAYVAPSYSEGFSISILEGMASGLPCVITRECNFPEAAVAGAAHVVSLDSEAIAAALQQVLEDLDNANAMGRNAQKLVFDHYTWERAADKLIQLYRRVSVSPATATASVVGK